MGGLHIEADGMHIEVGGLHIEADGMHLEASIREAAEVHADRGVHRSMRAEVHACSI
jgi:hypothetical protein